MNKLFPILFGVAIGSAATYFAMDARPSVANAPSGAEKIAAPKSASKFAGKPTSPSGDAPEAEAPRKSGGSKFGSKGGFLPEEIDGITPEQLDKCKAALMKSMQDEDVRAARAKQGELFKEAQYASDEDKRGMAKQFEEIQLEVRAATKAAMIAADADITDDVADKVLDAIEERMKQRRQQFQQNGKKK
ncbi:MAG: hypothetical protein CAK86_06010 [Opitutia bacterium AMD-G1]|nr:MAG: hypothetical protein CAK86_06010 [Opitutae bacterium AMD-G1]